MHIFGAVKQNESQVMHVMFLVLFLLTYFVFLLPHLEGNPMKIWLVDSGTVEGFENNKNNKNCKKQANN